MEITNIIIIVALTIIIDKFIDEILKIIKSKKEKLNKKIKNTSKERWLVWEVKDKKGNILRITTERTKKTEGKRTFMQNANTLLQKHGRIIKDFALLENAIKIAPLLETEQQYEQFKRLVSKKRLSKLQ